MFHCNYIWGHLYLKCSCLYSRTCIINHVCLYLQGTLSEVSSMVFCYNHLLVSYLFLAHAYKCTYCPRAHIFTCTMIFFTRWLPRSNYAVHGFTDLLFLPFPLLNLLLGNFPNGPAYQGLKRMTSSHMQKRLCYTDTR